MKHRVIAAALLFAAATVAPPATAQLSIGISVRLAPPPLPVYVQPPLPGPDYLWTPGYWAWDPDAGAYFWVPGTWVRAPRPGLLWTPPWWGWSDGLYLFHAGYWGPRVGFYGGVPYGFGYTGVGFFGGYWNGGHVFYNRTVTNVTNVTNIYQKNVVVNRVTRVSYNGGPGGVQARPSPQEQAAAHDPHIAATGNQEAHFAAARSDPRAFATANHGRPPMPATDRPLAAAGGPRPQPARPQAVMGAPARSPRAPGPDRGAPDRPAQPGRPAPAVRVDRGMAQADAARPGPAQAPEAFDRAPRSDRGDAGGRPPHPAARPDGFSPPPAPRAAPHAAPRPRPPAAPHPHPAPHPQPHPAEHHEEHH